MNFRKLKSRSLPKIIVNLLFLSLAKGQRSRTLNYFHGLQSSGVPVTWCQFESVKDFLRAKKSLRELLLKGRIPVVTSPSHLLSILVFVVLRKRPILDAGWPLIDGVVHSRREFGLFGLRALMTYLIDFFSFQCSALVFLESVNQVSRVKRLYGVRKGKMRVLMTGVDENRFRDLKFQAFSRQMGDRPVFEVLFRGGPQSESGLDKIKYLLESHILDSSTFLNIISPSFQTNGREIVKFSASNSLVSDQEIVNAYGAANLVIGQISNHKRLRYTVPHRFYESAFFGRPYLTGPLPDIGCPLPLESLLILGRNSTDEVVSALNFASQSKLDLVEKGINLKTWYEANCTQVILASHFYNYVKTFFPF